MINLELAEIALSRAGGIAFERFFHAIVAAIYGERFVPIGGVSDGGADAFLEPIYGESQATRFLQASVQQDYQSKIAQTVARLKEVGRQPRELTYCTSRIVPRIDQEDDRLTDEIGVTIRIRDQKWILAQLNQSTQTKAAFKTYLEPELAFLKHLGGATLLDTVNNADTRALFVFLEQELARRRNQSDLLQSTTDSLILWSLEETDPDLKKFMTRGQILSRIETILPSSKHFIRNSIDHRLAQLSSKGNPTGREIRHYKKDDLYCLPFETRLKVQEENASDELLKKHFIEEQITKAEPHFLAGKSDNSELVARITHTAIEKAFESQGIELAAFLEGASHSDQQLSMSDYVDSAIADLDGNIDHVHRAKLKDIALDALRTMLYESSQIERDYLGKLSRTYALLFTLRADARVIEYFRNLSTKLVLYIGADLLVRALSEHYLRTEDKMTCNLLEILKNSGATLILNENAANEVISNLRTSDHEYNNWYKWSEPNVTLSIARHCPKILVRSYFYAKLNPPQGIASPSGWAKFIDQFVTYGSLHHPRGGQELQDYLCRRFKLEFESSDQMLNSVDKDHLEGLTEMIQEVRNRGDKAELLARNDALQVLRVYAKRKEINDRNNGPFGYRVWWLTHEFHVMRVTGPLVKYYDARYIMRPEFVLNFIALAPTTQEVRTAYAHIFPTLISIKLSNRMKNDVFHDVLGRYKRACEYDPARIEVKMQELTNRLKGDNYKQYEIELNANAAQRD